LQQLTVFSREGTIVSRIGEPGSYSQASFSPDGSRLAVIKRDPDSDSQDVWAFDIGSGKGTAVTSDSAPDTAPVWSPDGRSIAYVSVRDNTHGVYRRPADGSGSEERLYEHPTGATIFLTDWSADGRYLCLWSGDSMFVVPVTGDRKPIDLNKEAFPGRGGRVSPDSRFLAFSSNQSGRFQVIVSPFDPATAATSGAAPGSARSQISTEGGFGGIVWRRDGKELFYLSFVPQKPQSLMAVDITTTPAFQAQTPRPLFELPAPVGPPAQLGAVGSPDGQRFVFAVNLPTKPAK
jgi:Tol biopolymer transport system component